MIHELRKLAKTYKPGSEERFLLRRAADKIAQLHRENDTYVLMIDELQKRLKGSNDD